MSAGNDQDRSNQGWTGPIAWMARNSIAANLLMVLLLAGGVWMAFEVQKEVFPEFQLDMVQVTVSYLIELVLVTFRDDTS